MTLLASYQTKPARITGVIKTMQMADGYFTIEYDADTLKVVNVTNKLGLKVSERLWEICQEEVYYRIGVPS